MGRHVHTLLLLLDAVACLICCMCLTRTCSKRSRSTIPPLLTSTCAVTAAADMISGTVRAIELFLDLTLAVFLIMGTYVAHRMIVEKMQMKKEKANVMTDRKDAQKGGGEDDDDDDDDAAPAAVPLDEDKPKVVKAASRQDARRRHA